MGILTEKATIAILISDKIDFNKRKALLGMKELLHIKVLQEDKEFHYACSETASKINKAYIDVKGETGKSITMWEIERLQHTFLTW